MKKILFLLLLLPFAGMAQFNKGQIFLGGSLTGQSQNTNPNAANGTVSTLRTYGVYPKVGIFVSSKWAVGGSLGYSYSRSADHYISGPNSFTQDANTNQTFNAGVFTRRYFSLTDKFFFVLEGSVNLSRRNLLGSSSTAVNGNLTFMSNSHIKQYDLSGSIRPYFVFFPTPKWSFELGAGNLGFDHIRNLTTHGGSNNFSISALAGFSIGANYYFGRK